MKKFLLAAFIVAIMVFLFYRHLFLKAFGILLSIVFGLVLFSLFCWRLADCFKKSGHSTGPEV